MVEKLYFSISELCKSDTAKQYSIDNAPTTMEQIDNMVNLIHNVLQPLRVKIGKAVIVNSGYRCPLLNNRVGGVRNSQHLTGQAADIRVNGVPHKTLFEYIKNSDIVYDQLILEKGCVHVSYSSKHNRMQAFTL